MPQKIVSAADAVALIREGDTVTTSGFVGIGVPEALLVALEERFVQTGAPRDLTLLFAAGQGDGRDRGLNHLGHSGLLKRVIGGHWGLIPKVAKLAVAGEIEAWNLPQGVISHMFRDIAAGKPATVTPVGLGTFVDPRLEGGRVNDRSTDTLVEAMVVAGQQVLAYRTMPIDVALLRGTTADRAGNVTMEREALIIDNLAQAMAVKNSGGLVIVQVERTVARGSLSPREVQIPGALVDAVVVAPAEHHMQTFATGFSHTFTGRYRAAPGDGTPAPMDARKVIARRCAFELPINGIINLGIGMPEGVAGVAEEEGLLEHVTLTAEPGVIGGQPASGLDFGAAVNTDAVIPQHQQFDFYDGGGLDLAILGMAEVGGQGDVNVSRFGDRLAGAGGFINISQNARQLVFAGTFTAGGLAVKVAEGLRVLTEGRMRKFVSQVGQVTFSAARARTLKQPVLFVTERCVLSLCPEGLRLDEIAPGVDLERDVLAHMAVRPEVADVALMDPRIFADGPMGLRTDLLHLDLAERIALESGGERLFINFEKMRLRTPADIDAVRNRVEEVCGPLDTRVDVIANYDGTRIDEDIEPAFVAMVEDLERRFYATVTRYAGSAFMRLKLGRAFRRGQGAHIFETRAAARAFLDQSGG